MTVVLISVAVISVSLIIRAIYIKNENFQAKTELTGIDPADIIGSQETLETTGLPASSTQINMEDIVDITEQNTAKPESSNVTIPETPLRPALMAGDNSVCINWLNVSDAQYYQIFYSQNGIDYKFLDDISSTAYLAQNLTPDTEYYFKIRAVSSDGGEGEFSASGNVRTEEPYAQPSGYAKTDLMIVPTHMDDELIFFGGILPYYSKYLNKKTELVFTCDNGGKRKKQERESLNVMKLNDLKPQFLGFLGNFRMAEKDTWQQNPDDGLIIEMVRAIRKNRPNVIVTHDTNGEYGHPQHILTTLILTRALQKCADPNYDKKSADDYGTWMPKKVYIHLYPKNEIKLNYSEPLDCYNGKNAFKMADLALQKHPNALKTYRIYYTDDTYDSSRFGLYYSSVGPDKNNDLFDNL